MKIGLILLIVLTGAGIPVQVAMNAKLRAAVVSPPLTIAIAFAIGCLAMLALTFTGAFEKPNLAEAVGAPWWALGGGLFSAAAVLVATIALKQTGAAPVIAGNVFGQLVAAIVLDNFGWLGVEKSPVNAWKIGGALLLFAGALMMQKK